MSKLHTIVSLTAAAESSVLKLGEEVVVDGLQGRGYVTNIKDGRITVKFRSGLILSRHKMYVHPVSGNQYKSIYQSNLNAAEESVEREGPVPTTYKRYIQKQGTLFCVRSTNPSDKNFGCYGSREEAEFRLKQGANIKHDDLDAVSQYGDTGWTYGRTISRDTGFIPKRNLGGFPRSGATSSGPTRKPNPSVGAIRPRLEAEEWGEPMTGNMSHAHIDPVVWFKPPSLAKRMKPSDRIPTDDPKEDNDKFGDVTKRNSKDTKEQRMKLLKRGGPGGLPPQIPVRTTLIAPHSASYLPGQLNAGKMKRTKGMAFTSYSRRGCL